MHFSGAFFTGYDRMFESHFAEGLRKLGAKSKPETVTAGNGVLSAIHTKPVAVDGMIGCVAGHLHWSSSELRRLSQENGYARALIHAYRQRGESFLDSIGGQFTAALIATETRTAWLIQDRVGTHSLYYVSDPSGGLFFSTVLTVLAEHPKLQRRVSNQAIYDYFYFQMIPSPGTIYQSIRKLGPAQVLKCHADSFSSETYWKPRFGERLKETSRELSGELHRVLRKAVSSALNQGGAAGAFLSGGLDSSTVVGVLSAISARASRSFSIGFNAKGYDETPYARITARRFKTNHHEYFVTPADVVDFLPRMARAYDEPFGNSSAIPAFYCARLAKENGVDLMLAGDGGDELFAGNERYATQQIFERFNRLTALLRKGLIEPLVPKTSFAGFSLLSKARSFLNQADLPLPDRMETYNFLRRDETAGLFADGFLETVDPDAPIREQRERYSEITDATAINRMLYYDWKFTLADNDLRKVSTMCELAGVKVVYPMLDDLLLELSCRVPSRWKLKPGKLRYFYKQAMKGFLPDEILVKKKHGFGLPFGVWMTTEPALQSLAYDSIITLKRRGFFNSDYLDNVVKLHRTQHAAFYGTLIWLLVALEIWFEHHLDAK